MSDSLSWIDDADIARIRGILTRSVDAIVIARQDLEKNHAATDSLPSAVLPERELLCRSTTQQHVTSAQRRARLRRLLRNPENAATASDEAIRTLRVDPRGAEQIEERVEATSSAEAAKRQRGRRERRALQARFQHEEYEEPRKWDGQLNRHQGRPNEETAISRRLPNNFSALFVSWTRRLDYLTNVAIGVLAIALVISLFVSAGQRDPHRGVLPLVANAKTSGDQQAAMASEASLYPAQGFNILPREFREPLPTFVEDISGLLLLAAPLPGAPGIAVLTYTGLPKALPAFPKDIAQLIMLASSPGPDGRDYLIRTLVFEASGETEIGQFAVAHAILNRKRSGRWGRKISDVVTSPWQFEPWMTRRREIEGLSRTDPRYLEAAEVVDAVLAGHVPDPTAGATHFLNPVIVRERRGDSLPSWADSHGRPIGRHVFYCPECDGTKRKQVASAGAGEAKGSKAAPVPANRVRPLSVAQQKVAEAPEEVGAAKAATAALQLVAEKPEARLKPELTTQRRKTNLPWLNASQARQRRNFVPHAFW